MIWTPRTYQDHMDEGGENILKADQRPSSHPGRWYISKCPNTGCNRTNFASMMLVDCRLIDNAIIPEDWACDNCWTSWVLASGSPTNLLLEIKQQGHKNTNFGNDLPLGRADAILGFPLRGNRASTPLRDELNKAVALGLEVKTKRLHCFTLSHWLELHGAPQEMIDARKKTRADLSH